MSINHSEDFNRSRARLEEFTDCITGVFDEVGRLSLALSEKQAEIVAKDDRIAFLEAAMDVADSHIKDLTRLLALAKIFLEPLAAGQSLAQPVAMDRSEELPRRADCI